MIWKVSCGGSNPWSGEIEADSFDHDGAIMVARLKGAAVGYFNTGTFVHGRFSPERFELEDARRRFTVSDEEFEAYRQEILRSLGETSLGTAHYAPAPTLPGPPTNRSSQGPSSQQGPGNVG